MWGYVLEWRKMVLWKGQRIVGHLWIHRKRLMNTVHGCSCSPFNVERREYDALCATGDLTAPATIHTLISPWSRLGLDDNSA